MERLGDDMLVSIFSLIRNKDDQKSFIQVSKQFLRVACLRLRIRQILFPNLLYILPESPRMITFECSKPLSNNHMKLLAQSCPNLQILKLQQSVNPCDFDFDDDGLCAVANACNHLREVNLSNRLYVSDVGVVSLVTSSSKNLRRLDLNGCVNVTDESLKAIGETTCLKYLRLQGCYLITDLGLKYLANGDLKNSLVGLVLAECDRISDIGLSYLKRMVGLFFLDLSKCEVNITDSRIVAPSSKIPSIMELLFSWLINFSDISLSDTPRKCSNPISKGITSVGLRALANHPNLVSLELFSCNNFSLEDVQSVALSCPKLKILGLSKEMKTPIRATQLYPPYSICWK